MQHISIANIVMNDPVITIISPIKAGMLEQESLCVEFRIYYIVIRSTNDSILLKSHLNI